VKDTPFDLKHYPHLIYEERKISALKTQLGQRIKRLVENSRGSQPRAEPALQLSINGMPAGERPTARMNTGGYVYFDIGIHNPAGHVLVSESYSLALILPGRADFFSPGGVSGTRLKEGQYIYTLSQNQNILPFGWLTLEVKFNLFLKNYDTAEAAVRLFAAGSFEDYKVILKN
jgi:hypothetical protein